MVDAVTFRRACAKFTTGVAIATVIDRDGAPHGMTVNSFTSVSAEPPLVLICVDRSSSLLSLFRHQKRIGISVLRLDQSDLSVRFSLRGQDRFDGLPWESGATGVPLIPGAIAHLECTIRRMIEAGDHEVLIAEVLETSVRGGSPLLYFESGYRNMD